MTEKTPIEKLRDWIDEELRKLEKEKHCASRSGGEKLSSMQKLYFLKEVESKAKEVSLK